MESVSSPPEVLAAPSPRPTARSLWDIFRRHRTTFSSFFGTQLVVQLVTAISGVVLLRYLPRVDYAQFLIANMIQSNMVILSDLGIGSALSALAGRCWEDKAKFSQVMQSGHGARKQLVLVVAGLCLPVMLWLMLKNDATLLGGLFACMIVLVGVRFQVSNSILMVALRFHSQAKKIQRVTLLGALLRLALIFAAAHFLNWLVAVAIASVVLAAQHALLVHWVRDMVDFGAKPDAGHQRAILSVVKKQAPNALYFCFQGQGTMFLVSVFGGHNQIADLGALTRFLVIFTVLQTTFHNLYVAKFAKARAITEVIRTYKLVVVTFLLAAMVPCAFLCLFPKTSLLVLGPNYSQLGQAVPLIGIMGLLTAVAGILSLLNQARAWIMPARQYIVVSLVATAVLAPVIRWNSIYGVLTFQLIMVSLSIVLYLRRAREGFKQGRLVESLGNSAIP